MLIRDHSPTKHLCLAPMVFLFVGLYGWDERLCNLCTLQLFLSKRSFGGLDLWYAAELGRFGVYGRVSAVRARTARYFVSPQLANGVCSTLS